MRLEVDIGNTFLKWRYCVASDVLHRGSVLTQDFSLVSFSALAGCEVEKVLVGSVAGDEPNQCFGSICKKLWAIDPIFAATSHHCAGVTNSYKEPSKMGVDRWLAMIAAYKSVNRAVVIVDCGSAITVEYISDEGRHKGGYIIPGLRLMRESLQQNTARVRFDGLEGQLATHPGINTAEAVLQGSGYLFKALAHEIKRDLAEGEALFFTGGDGKLMRDMVQAGRYEADLVMDGLMWVCQ